MAKSDDAATAPAAGKGKLKMILLIVLALLLAIGVSVGATWYFMHSAQSKPVPAAETASNVKQPAIFEQMLPAFVANYNQNGRQRYLQVSISLLARNQADLDALKVHMPVIRNNLMMLFSGQSFRQPGHPGGPGNAAPESHCQRAGSGPERTGQSRGRAGALH